MFITPPHREFTGSWHFLFGPGSPGKRCNICYHTMSRYLFFGKKYCDNNPKCKNSKDYKNDKIILNRKLKKLK